MNRPDLRQLLIPTVTLALGPAMALLRAQCTPQWQAGAEVAGVVGAVHATLEWDPDGAGPATPVLVAGGAITAAGNQPVRGIAQWDPATGAWSPLGTGLTGEVFALATLASGELVAAGSLTAAGGAAVDRVARWNGSAWSPFGGGLDGDVLALHVQPGGELVIGGAFTAANGVPLAHVARWNGSAWAPLGAGLPHKAMAFATLPGGALVAGWGPEPSFYRSYVSRWDGTSWSWLTTLSGGNPSLVRALDVLPNGDLVVAGSFHSCTQVQAASIVRWDGSTWSPFGLGIRMPVYDLQQLPGGRLLAAAANDTGSGVPGGVVEWDGSAWAAVAGSENLAAPGGYVRALTLLGNGNLVAAGDLGGRSTAQWDGATWRSLGSGPDRAMAAMTVRANGEVVALAANATSLLRWDGQHWSSLPGATNAPIRAVVELPAGDLIAAGDFTTIGGVAANHIARWDGSAWRALGNGLDAAALTLAVLPSGDLVAGGVFTQAGGVPVTRIARWDGVAWSAMGNPTFYSAPFTHLVVAPDGSLFAACNGILHWNGATWIDTGAPMINNPVGAMAMILGDRLAVARNANVPVVHVYEGAQWVGLVAANGSIAAIASLPDRSVVLGGAFSTIGGQAANGLARSFAGSWQQLGGGITGGVRTLAWQPRGALLAGGSFTQVGAAVLSPYFAPLAAACPAEAIPLPNSCTGTLGPVTLTALSQPWIGSAFRSRATGFAPGSIGIALVGLSAPNLPLSLIWPNTAPGCAQVSSGEAILLQWPQDGTAGYAWEIPNSVAFAGLPLYHQFLQFEISSGNQLGALSGSNGLRLVLGAF
ncbi:MAG: hypothetical protein JNK49_20580 [Planctomycetes bacterium]|nr:hypothetical protein [Planctomycetota bacterium]